MAVVAWDCADDEYRERAYNGMAAEIEQLRAALRKIEERTTDPVARSIAGEILVVLDHEQKAPAIFCADHPHCPCGSAKMDTCNWTPAHGQQATEGK